MRTGAGAQSASKPYQPTPGGFNSNFSVLPTNISASLHRLHQTIFSTPLRAVDPEQLLPIPDLELPLVARAHLQRKSLAFEAGSLCTRQMRRPGSDNPRP